MAQRRNSGVLIEEGKDVWAIARVARNPFGLKEKEADVKQAFVRHNLKTGGEVEGEGKEIRVGKRTLWSTHTCYEEAEGP